jgi:hypothetical protein
VRLITEQLIGSPNQNETTELVGKLKKVRVMIVEQRWFGLELLEKLPGKIELSQNSFEADETTSFVFHVLTAFVSI